MLKRIRNQMIASGLGLSAAVAFATPAFATPAFATPAFATPAFATPAFASSPAEKPAADAISRAREALSVLAGSVRRMSHPKALESAFRSYFAYLSKNPDTKPYLYYVDYGLPNTQPRGYVFDMKKMAVVEGPFTVAHGRGSGERGGVPQRFSNANGSYATSLGLYRAAGTYTFTGSSGGRRYSSVGLRLKGESGSFNNKAMSRGVVAHGAPYVTPSRAGRSEGCPAMEPARAQRLLPKLANGGVVFLFAPNANWMSSDPWIAS